MQPRILANKRIRMHVTMSNIQVLIRCNDSVAKFARSRLGNALGRVWNVTHACKYRTCCATLKNLVICSLHVLQLRVCAHPFEKAVCGRVSGLAVAKIVGCQQKT